MTSRYQDSGDEMTRAPEQMNTYSFSWRILKYKVNESYSDVSFHRLVIEVGKLLEVALRERNGKT